MAKAAELGPLRYEQRASVHQLLREYHLLGTLLEQFITDEVAAMGPDADPVGAFQALSRVSHSVRVLQQQTVDTFVGNTPKPSSGKPRTARFTRLVSHESASRWASCRSWRGCCRLTTRPRPPREMLGRNVDRLGDVAGKLERLARCPA